MQDLIVVNLMHLVNIINADSITYYIGGNDDTKINKIYGILIP